ncbi:unnamed protein product, partial [Soboliphyme baturini]|uniref:DUF223 domain-containing protein n=1 Tax=Soboliphyme baturini TaxID=241478 RepID=A0A183JB73_9BILA
MRPDLDGYIFPPIITAKYSERLVDEVLPMEVITVSFEIEFHKDDVATKEVLLKVIAVLCIIALFLAMLKTYS